MERKERNGIIQYLIMICALVALILLIYYRWKTEDVKIKKFLAEQGYHVEQIEFTKVEGKYNLYKASEAIDIGVGEPVEYWEIIYWGSSMSLYFIKPYPDWEFTKPVSVDLSFSSNEYELLKNMADGEPLEDYIKELIFNSK